MELKPLQDLKASELDKVPNPSNARFWIQSARNSDSGIRGFRDIWEQCIHEVDPRRDYWNHKNLGFERLLDYLERGNLVLVFDLWPLHQINRAYVEKDGRWQAQSPFLDAEARRRLDHHAEVLQQRRREREAYESWHSPQPTLETESVTGPGSRTATLGPHVGDTLRTETTNTPVSKSINDQFNDLKTQGHGPQRHEGDVTPKQLEDRCTKGIDPMSGTKTDSITGKTHKYSANATKVNTPEDYVNANNKLKSSQEFKDKAASAEISGENIISVKGEKLKDIYGAEYQSKVMGKTRIGTKANPEGVSDTVFTDSSTMKGVYKKGENGDWNLVTMYPEP